MTSAGEPAPDFAAKDDSNAPITLSEFRGRKLLIAFFPFAFSPVCTEEHRCFADDLSEFKDLGIDIIGISVDSHWALAAFRRSLGIEHILVSDFSKSISKQYDVLRPDGFAERAYFLVDGEGVVRWKHVMPAPGTKLDNKELLEAIRKIG